jgi:FG-GAP repeat
MATLTGFDTKRAAWLATFALVALPLTGPGLAPARAETDVACGFNLSSTTGDFDGDGLSDVAVGVPNAASKAGAVDIHLSGGGSQRLTQGTTHPDDEFGAALLQVEAGASEPNCTGLVVGAPGEHSDRGELFYYTAFSGTPMPSLTAQVVGAHNGDRFGSSFAIGKDGLYVGAPGATVNGHKGAGAVYVYSYRPDNSFLGPLETVITQDSPGIPGTAEAGDEFGATLSLTYTGVVIGSPGESIGTAAGAGSVTFISEGIPVLAQSWSQNSAGVPGTAEAGDHFGASLAGGGWPKVLVGVPGEDIGHLKDAGQVQYFIPSTAGYKPGPAVTQNTGGVPGTAEAGDGFGASVAQQDRAGFLVGAPGEDVGSVKDAGSVTFLKSTSGPLKAISLTEGGIVGGAPQTGARFGATVSTRAGLVDSELDFVDNSLISAPGDDVDGIAGAGDVVDVPLYGPAHEARRLTDSAGPTAHEGYGAALSYSQTVV